MKPANFCYAAPGSITEVLALLADHGEQAKLLAGGQSLVAMLNLRLTEPAFLIDLNRVPDLAFIRRERDTLRIGAMTRHRTVEQSADVAAAEPLIARAAREIGHLAIRNRGTIGGSLMHADPAAEWPLLAVTLDARLTLRSASGSRTVKARDFFLGPLTTAARADELLTEIVFPLTASTEAWGFSELCRRPGDFAIVAVACRVSFDKLGVCASASLAVGGADATPKYIGDLATILRGCRGEPEVLREAGQMAAKTVEPGGDIHASAAYRGRMTAVLSVRALREAFARAPAEPDR